MVICNYFWSYFRLNSSQILIEPIYFNVFIQIFILSLPIFLDYCLKLRDQILLFFFNSNSIQVFIHISFNVPYKETWVIHGSVVVACCKKFWVYRVPRHSIAMPLVLYHSACHEYFFYLWAYRNIICLFIVWTNLFFI